MNNNEQFYSENAEALMVSYNSISFEEVHSGWRKYWPRDGELFLDVGAGGGRDALWAHKAGARVIAVEPCAELLELALEATGDDVFWLNDSLPSLSELFIGDMAFDCILIEGVLMHLSPAEQVESLATLASLLAVGGRIIIKARTPNFSDSRTGYDLATSELLSKAEDIGLVNVGATVVELDKLGREDVIWKQLIFTAPRVMK